MRSILLATFALVQGLGVGATLAAESPAPPRAAILSGRVVDARSSQPILGARLRTRGAEAMSDAQGYFRLAVADEDCLIVVRAEGYRDGQVRAPLGGRTAAELRISLTPMFRIAETVEVVAGADSDALARHGLAPGAVAAVPGAAENVFRVLETLPGVAGANEIQSRISVRGGGPDENLTVMDGVEIHNPFRLDGLMAAFNPDTTRSFDLATGAFSAKYGDRLSSLLLIETRDGAGDRLVRGTAALSLGDANLVGEGRLARGTWILAARRTYYDLIAERFVHTDLPAFGDLQLKLAQPLGHRSRVTLLALRSREWAHTAIPAVDGGRAGDQFRLAGSNDLIAASLRSTFGPRACSTTSLSLSSSVQDLGFLDARASSPVDAGRVIRIRDLALRQELAVEVGRSQLIETGFELHRLATGWSWSSAGLLPDDEWSQGAATGPTVLGRGLPSSVVSDEDSTRGGLWIEVRHRLGSRVSLQTGLRADRSSANDSAFLSPRLSAALELGRGFRLRGAVGRHVQSPGIEKLMQSDYFVDMSAINDSPGLPSPPPTPGESPNVRRVELPALAPLSDEQSWHTVLGVDRKLGSGLSARVEAYFKTFSDLIIGRLETESERLARLARYDFPTELQDQLPVQPLVTRFPSNAGRGLAYGLDVFVSRTRTSPASRLGGWLAYSYGVARRKAYGRTYPFDYDRRHALSLVGAFRLSRRFELSTTCRLASGFPATPDDVPRLATTEDLSDRDGDGDRHELIPVRDQGGYVYRESEGGFALVNSRRLPYYARLDVRLTFAPHGGAGSWAAYLDLINAFNRRVERLQTMPRLVSLGIHARF